MDRLRSSPVQRFSSHLWVSMRTLRSMEGPLDRETAFRGPRWARTRENGPIEPADHSPSHDRLLDQPGDSE